MAPIAITPDSFRSLTPSIDSPSQPSPSEEKASTLTLAGINHALPTQQSPLDASLLKVQLTTSPRPVPLPGSAEVAAQKTCTDHMICCRWTVEHGWEAPELKPYGPLTLMPTASVLHYATECFEGLKLYRGYDGKLRLFRVDRNCERMRKSAARIALPDFDPVELRKLILALCAQDGAKWLPKERPGSFLYLRPTFIGTDEALGVQRPREALLYIIMTCFPDMTKGLSSTPTPPALSGTVQPAQPSGLKLLASSEDSIRAWPGGFGYAKVGANYGPSLVAQGEARARGFDQVLWLFGRENFVTEAGASNFFVVWRNKETGRLELVTAPLGERIILEGVTRASVLDLARERLSASIGDLGPLDVVEKRFTMSEIVEAYREGRLIEAFAAGTAFFIAPVGLIHFRGEDLAVPLENGESGLYTRLVKQWLVNIMYGKESHEWGVIVNEVA